jgi:hypothetical protein
MYSNGNSFNGNSTYSGNGDDKTEPSYYHQMGYKTLGEDIDRM